MEAVTELFSTVVIELIEHILLDSWPSSQGLVSPLAGGVNRATRRLNQTPCGSGVQYWNLMWQNESISLGHHSKFS